MRHVFQSRVAGALVAARGLRQRATRWGATDEEAGMILPGEELVPHPNLVTTSALTIGATSEDVWPWLMQFGQGRAGWYQNSKWWDTLVDWYYRLLSRERTGQAGEGYMVRSQSTLLPELQSLQVGDVIPDGPPGTVAYIVRQLEPRKALVLYSNTHLPYVAPGWMRESPSLGIYGELSDAYLLRPLKGGRTRLIRRMRMRCGPLPFRLLVVPLVLIWGELLTARHFLLGVKKRAEERRSRPPLPSDAQAPL